MAAMQTSSLPSTQQPNKLAEAAEDGETGMGGLFDDAEGRTGASAFSPIQIFPLFEANLPPGWTAAPPRSVLADLCRKRMIDQPIFKSLCDYPKHFRSSVTVGNETFSCDMRCLTKAEAHDLAATRALFVLCGSSQTGVRSVLPPAYRDKYFFFGGFSPFMHSRDSQSSNST